MLKILSSCFRAAVCLSPNVVSGLVGVGLKRVGVRSVATYVASYFDKITINVRVYGKNAVVCACVNCSLD